jgi:hypothetical protein
MNEADSIRLHTEFLASLCSYTLSLPRAPRLKAASSREFFHMQVGQCGNQMGTKFWGDDVRRGGIGGEYCGERCCHPKSPVGDLFRPGGLVNQNAGAGNNWAKVHYEQNGYYEPYS